MDEEPKSLEFYKAFYENNRIALLQYKSLRNNFNSLVESVLGEDYYNEGMDVYECDRISCEHIKDAARKNWFQRIFRLR